MPLSLRRWSPLALALLMPTAIVVAGCTPKGSTNCTPCVSSGPTASSAAPPPSSSAASPARGAVDADGRPASCRPTDRSAVIAKLATRPKPTRSNPVASRWLEQCEKADGYGADDESSRNPFCPATGDPLPSPPATHPHCPTNANDEVRWLSSRPVVPFARLQDGRLTTAGSACCASWSRRGEVLLAVDDWGQPIRKHTVASGDGYDVTDCFELILEPEPQGAVLFVSTGYEPRPSFEWKPTQAQQNALRETLFTYHRVLVEEGEVAEATRAAATSARFFSMDADRECKMLGYAAVGGLSTTIWQLPKGGAWSLMYQRAPSSFDFTAYTTVFNPIAILDMDRSGVPEVVVRFDDRISWFDFALRFNGSHWEVGAESVGGATL